MAAFSEHARPLLPVPGGHMMGGRVPRFFGEQSSVVPRRYLDLCTRWLSGKEPKKSTWTARHVGPCEEFLDRAEGFSGRPAVEIDTARMFA